jgi:hypothetical protein
MNIRNVQIPVVAAAVSDEEQDLHSLCYSSLSEGSCSSNEEENIQKVRSRQYSRLAFTIQNVGKDDFFDGTTNHNSDDVDDRNDTEIMPQKRQTTIELDLSKLDIGKRQLAPSSYPSSYKRQVLKNTDTATCATKTKKKVIERKYSRLAFSIQQLSGGDKK